MKQHLMGTVEYIKTISVPNSDIEEFTVFFVNQQSSEATDSSAQYSVIISGLSKVTDKDIQESKETILYWDVSEILNETFFTVEAFRDDTCLFCGQPVQRTASDMYTINEDSLSSLTVGDTISENVVRATLFLCHHCASAFQNKAEDLIPPEITVSLRI